MQPPVLTQHMVAPPPLPVAYLRGAGTSPVASGGSQRSALVVGLIGLACLLTLAIVYFRFFSRYCTACDTAGALQRTGSRVDGFWAVFPTAATAAASQAHHPAASGASCLDPPPVGLPRDALSLVPMLKFHKVPATTFHHHHQYCSNINNSSNITNDCAVCLSPFQDADHVRLLPVCHHIFHGPCIDAWLLSSVTCPMCRTPVLPHLTKMGPVPSPASIVLTVEPH